MAHLQTCGKPRLMLSINSSVPVLPILGSGSVEGLEPRDSGGPKKLHSVLRVSRSLRKHGPLRNMRRILHRNPLNQPPVSRSLEMDADPYPNTETLMTLRICPS